MELPVEPTEDPGDRRARSRWRHGIRFFLRRPGLVLALIVIALVIVAGVAPSVFTSLDPLLGVPQDYLSAPSAAHWFGTDEIGRDLFTRVVYGASLSLQAAVLAILLGLVLGTILGLLAGYIGGWLDDVVMRIVDVLLAIPALLLSLAMVTGLGFGTVHVAIAVGTTTIASFARVMRSEVLTIRHAVYVEAARATGARWFTVLRRHVLPHAWGPVLVLATLEFGMAILAVSALSFLGYGAPPPAPEWGALIADGRDYLATSWWLCTAPGLVVVATVLAINRLSRMLDGEWSRYREGAV
jgi:peptide/nickel transport system permease protein